MKYFILACFCLFVAVTSVRAEEKDICDDNLILQSIVNWESATITDDPLMPIKMFINPDPKAQIQEVFVTFGYIPLEGAQKKKRLPVLLQYRDGEHYCLLSFTYESLENEESQKMDSI